MKFYGGGFTPLDKILYERYFSNWRNGFYLEAGAYDGLTGSSCKFLEDELGWDGINLEPVPYHFANLMKNRPNARNYPLALSNKTGKATFNNPIHPVLGKDFGNGSLCHTPEHNKVLGGVEREIFEVETITYKDLIDRLQITRMDLIVLDVEGTEMDVIEGFAGATVLPRILCLEHGYKQPWDFVYMCGQYGYKLDYYHENNSFFIKVK